MAKKISNKLVALSSALILSVYAAGIPTLKTPPIS